MQGVVGTDRGNKYHPTVGNSEGNWPEYLSCVRGNSTAAPVMKSNPDGRQSYTFDQCLAAPLEMGFIPTVLGALDMALPQQRWLAIKSEPKFVTV